MDRSAYVILGLCILGLFAWGPIVERMWPGDPTATSGELIPAASPSGTTNAATQNPSNQVTTPSPVAPQLNPIDSSALTVNRPEESLYTLENELARFIFTSHGGGLKQVELKNYPKTIDCSKDDEAEASELLALNEGSLYPLMGLQAPFGLDGDQVYEIETKTSEPNVVYLTKTIEESGLRFINRFVIGDDYNVAVSTQIKNTGDVPRQVPDRRRSIGMVAPTDTNEGEFFLTLYHNDGKRTNKTRASWFENRTLGCFQGTPRPLYAYSGSSAWAGAANQFFAIIADPSDEGASIGAIECATRALDGRTAFQTASVLPAAILEPDAFEQRNYDLYVGPKEYRRLSKLGDGKEDVMNFGYVGIFSKALLLAMNGIHALGPSYGWCIVLITLIVKLLFWPLTSASAKSMKRMSALQPQMKEIQEKYKEDPKRMNEKMMRFMKENRVNPLGGCWPILLQMPVFIGFFFMIKSAIELRGASFLWACDLSRPDTVFTIPGVEFPINPMPILMAVTMLMQIRSTPVAPGMDPTQAAMMRYMPMIFVVVLYNYSSGLTLYWTVQNLLSVIQTRITKANDPEKDGPAGKTLKSQAKTVRARKPSSKRPKR